MVKNISGNVEFYCMNGHAEPVLMAERERSDDGRDNFYACSKYMRRDEKHPDGYGEGEHGCANRLSFSDAGDIIAKFNEMVEDDTLAGVLADYTGVTFTHKHIKVKVLKYGGSKIKFGVINRKAVENAKA